MSTTLHPAEVPRATAGVRKAARSFLLATGLIATAGALAVFVVGPPADSREPTTKKPEQAPSATPSTDSPTASPPPPPEPDGPPKHLDLPDVFPPTAGDFHLESVETEELSAGIRSYHTARYVSSDGTAASVRLVGLDPEKAAAFTRKAMEELQRSPATQSVRLPADWRNPEGGSAGLFARDGAGLFVFGGSDRLVMVAAPDPDTAVNLGRSLLGR